MIAIQIVGKLKDMVAENQYILINKENINRGNIIVKLNIMRKNFEQL